MAFRHTDPGALERRLGPHLDFLYRLAWWLHGERREAQGQILHRLQQRRWWRRLAQVDTPHLLLARDLINKAGCGHVDAPLLSSGPAEGRGLLQEVVESEVVLAALDEQALSRRVPLLLRHAEGLSVAEVAVLLELSESATHDLLEEALEELRQQGESRRADEGGGRCRETRARLGLWLDGMGAARLAAVDTVGRHLSECSECRQVTRAEQALRHAVGRRSPPPPAPDYQVRARRSLGPRPRMAWLGVVGDSGWRRYTVPVVVGSVVVLLFVLWVAAQSAALAPAYEQPAGYVGDDGEIITPEAGSRDRGRQRPPRQDGETPREGVD